MGSSRHYNCARQQSGASAEKFNQGGNIEYHVVSIPILHHFVVENGFNGESVRVGYIVARHQAGAERGKGVETLAPAPLASTQFELPVARADVIAAGRIKI